MAEIDALGLLCPVPVLRLGRAAASAAPGTELTLVADDPLAPFDVEAWCAKEGHSLIAGVEEGGVFRLTVRVRGGPEA